MRVLLDANVLLDCLVTESSGVPRAGKAASDQVLNLCDMGVHQGLVAWHTLPIIAYYYGRQKSDRETSEMMDALLSILHVPTVTHDDAASWRRYGLSDFEDALQVASAFAGAVEVIVTRNTADFSGCKLPVMTPEAFLQSL